MMWLNKIVDEINKTTYDSVSRDGDAFYTTGHTASLCVGNAVATDGWASRRACNGEILCILAVYPNELLNK